MKTKLYQMALLATFTLQPVMAHEQYNGYHRHEVDHLQQRSDYLQSIGSLSSAESALVGEDLIDAVAYINAGSVEVARQYIEFIYEDDRFRSHVQRAGL